MANPSSADLARGLAPISGNRIESLFACGNDHVKENRDILIEEHLGYVKALATQLKRQISPRLDLDELVAFGSRGLVEAAERFDPARGASFTTFAYYRIRGAIFDGLRQMGWLSRSEYGRFSAATNEYLGNQSERQSSAAPAAASSSTEETVNELGRALGDVATIFITSLSASYQEDPPDIDTPDASARLESCEAQAAVHEAIARLPEKERRLLEGYYFQNLTLEDAGRALGLSKSWASRLHARAISLLSQSMSQFGTI
jgi:RNA polymerase sigma factor FliA